MEIIVVNTWRTRNIPHTIIYPNQIEEEKINAILEDLERILVEEKNALRTVTPNNSSIALPRYYAIILNKDGIGKYYIENIIGVKRHSNGWIPTKWALKPSFAYWTPLIIRMIYDALTSTSQ